MNSSKSSPHRPPMLSYFWAISWGKRGREEEKKRGREEEREKERGRERESEEMRREGGREGGRDFTLK